MDRIKGKVREGQGNKRKGGDGKEKERKRNNRIWEVRGKEKQVEIEERWLVRQRKRDVGK